MRWTTGRVALGAASVGGVGLFSTTLATGPVSPWISAAALGGYAALVVAGAIVPSLEMYGDVLCRLPPGKKRVCLTFDDGPHPETTPRVLAMLAEASMLATFFVVGEKAERKPEVVRRIADAGHCIGIHGYRHDRLYAFKPPKRVREDAERACAVVQGITSLRPVWFRPPLGHVSPRVVEGARRAGLRLVGWSVRGLDGISRASSDRVQSRIERGLCDGAIVLLHDAAEHDDRVPASIEVLPEILRAVKRAGLEGLTLDQAARSPAPR